MTDRSKPGSDATPPGHAAGLSRRKLIRAGLAGTPVLLGLKSQSVLATGEGSVCKPSMWNSIKKNNCRLSRQAIAQQGTCKPYNHWAGLSDTDCNRKFHDGNYSSGGYNYSGANFSKSYHSDRSLKSVCKTDWSSDNASTDELSRHCAAIYLNIKKGYSCPITETDCKAIWTACKVSGGKWNPSTQISWSASDCNEYLKYVCGYQLPTSC